MTALVALFATFLGGWILFNLIGAFLVGLVARAVFLAARTWAGR